MRRLRQRSMMYLPLILAATAASPSPARSDQTPAELQACAEESTKLTLVENNGGNFSVDTDKAITSGMNFIAGGDIPRFGTAGLDANSNRLLPWNDWLSVDTPDGKQIKIEFNSADPRENPSDPGEAAVTMDITGDPATPGPDKEILDGGSRVDPVQSERAQRIARNVMQRIRECMSKPGV